MDTELIVHGVAHPDARVTLRGEPVRLRADGSFAVRFSLPDRRHVLPVVAHSGDGAEQRTIVSGRRSQYQGDGAGEPGSGRVTLMPVLLRRLDDLPERFRGGAVAIGNFDGVHLGHARIVERLLTMARRLGGPAVILTFDPHPARLLRRAEAPMPLTWIERKVELLGELGVDAVLAYPTDQALLGLEPRAFFERVLRQALQVRGMVEGQNFFFGRGRQGTINVLQRLCGEAGVPLEIVEPAQVGRANRLQLPGPGSAGGGRGRCRTATCSPGRTEFAARWFTGKGGAISSVIRPRTSSTSTRCCRASAFTRAGLGSAQPSTRPP